MQYKIYNSKYKHDISCLSIFSFFVEFTLIFKVHVFNTLIAKKLDQQFLSMHVLYRVIVINEHPQHIYDFGFELKISIHIV